MIKRFLLLSILFILLSQVPSVNADQWCGAGQTCPEGSSRTALTLTGCHRDGNGVCIDDTSNYRGTCAGFNNQCGFLYFSGRCNHTTCTYTPRTDTYDCCPGVGEATPTPEPEPPTRTPTPRPICSTPTNFTCTTTCKSGNTMDVKWSWNSSIVSPQFWLQMKRDSSTWSSPDYQLQPFDKFYTWNNVGDGLWLGRVRVNFASQCTAPSAWAYQNCQKDCIAPTATPRPATPTPTRTPTPACPAVSAPTLVSPKGNI